MEKNQNIIYSEKQKLDVKKWIVYPLAIAIVVVIIIVAIPVVYFYFKEGPSSINEIANPLVLSIMFIGAVIPCLMIFFVRKRMELELCITKQGLQYDYLVLSTKRRFIPWEQVVSIESKKYPLGARRPGEQVQLSVKGNEAFIMNLSYEGIELTLKNGQTRFFSTNHADEFIKAIRKLELNFQIIK